MPLRRIRSVRTSCDARLSGFAACLSARPAAGWLDNGHMAISRLAWQKLTDDERRLATEILKQHPHYEEFLKAERPADAPEDEWVFMRASVWPDFVRNTHADKYNKPTWHYIDIGLCARPTRR